MIKKIATHDRPHLDEIAAIWLLINFGAKQFPGIKDAQIEIWSDDDMECSAEEYEKEGTLLIGIGGGRFDEHPYNGDPKNKECAATLVAKELGVNKMPELSQLLTFVRKNDTQGGAQPFDLASMVKSVHQQHPNDPLKVFNWAFAALDAKYTEQKKFWSCKTELKKARVKKIKGPKGSTLTLVVAESDNTNLQQFARSNHGVNADIVIQKNSSGNVQIFSNQRSRLDLCEVVKMLRLEEQKAKGKVLVTDWTILETAGKLPEIQEWYYHEPAQMVLNGSLSLPDVEPTKLSLDKITDIVKTAMNPIGFHEPLSLNCRRGKCLHCRENPCPFYYWGLRRCRRIRYKNG